MTLAGVSADERKGILVGGAIGGIVGGILGYFNYRRTQRLASEILESTEIKY